MSRHILTAVAWPYANGPRHIGHVAGFGVPSDVFSRYQRLAGNRVLMVSGTDEHGTPILVQADNEGVSAARARRPLQPRHRRGPAAPRPVLRPVHPDDDAQPLPRRAGAVPPAARQRLRHRAADDVRDLAVDRPHAARPLHRGHLPDLRVRRRARRPVRQLRQPARPRPARQPAQPDQRRDAEFVESQHFFLDLPAFADALGSWLQARTDWRPNVLKFSMNLVDDLKPRAISRDLDWGVPDPAARLGGPHRTSGSTCGSTRSSATCRRASSGPGAAATPTPGGPWWTEPATPSPTTSWARTTSSSTRSSGRRSCSGYNGEGATADRPATWAELELPTEVVSSEYLTMEGRKFSSSRSVVIYVRDFLVALLAPTRCATTCPLPARRPGHRLHLGGVRPPQQRRAGRRPGATSSTARCRSRRRTSARSPRPVELTDADRDLLPRPGRVRVGRCATRAVADEGRASPRRCASSPRPTSTSPTRRRGSCARRTRSGCATILHVALQAVSDCNTLLSPFLPHSAQQVHELLGRDRRARAGSPSCVEVDDLDGGPAYPVLTGDYDSRRAVGAASRSCPGRRSPRRRRCSPSSTRRSSTRSSRAWRPATSCRRTARRYDAVPAQGERAAGAGAAPVPVADATATSTSWMVPVDDAPWPRPGRSASPGRDDRHRRAVLASGR